MAQRAESYRITATDVRTGEFNFFIQNPSYEGLGTAPFVRATLREDERPIFYTDNTNQLFKQSY